MLATVKRREKICGLTGLKYLLNPCTGLDAQLHPGLYPKVGSSLDDKYSVTCVATKVARYIPCVIWISGGASVRSDYGCT